MDCLDSNTLCFAELPDIDGRGCPLLRDVVTSHLIHNPCGVHNPSASCMVTRDGKLYCSGRNLAHGTILSAKWVFALKVDADGRVERFKARLVARCFQKREDIDFDETFDPSFGLKASSDLDKPN